MGESNYFRRAGEFERNGKLDRALAVLLALRRDPRMSGARNVAEAGIRRIMSRVEQEGARMMRSMSIRPVHEHKASPSRSGAMEERGIAPVVSLTTISGRLDRVSRTVESILSQTWKPQAVNLYVSSAPHLIDEGIRSDDPRLAQIASLGVNIYSVPNLGPYRKQIPIILQLRRASADPETPIITIDDDVLYPPNIIESLMSVLNEGDTVVAHRGREIRQEGSGLGNYQSFGAPTERCSQMNLGTGKNGIAYRLKYFPGQDSDFIGPILAPTADDLWCKWAIAKYCIPTTILEPRAIFDSSLDFKELAPEDKRGLYHQYNAKGTNDEAMQNLEAYFAAKGNGLIALGAPRQ